MKSKFIKSILFPTMGGVLSASAITPIVLSSCGKKQTISVTSVKLDRNILPLKPSGSAQLKATVLPENATNKNVTWSSSNPSIASVDQNGNVKAISPGTAGITVTTEDGGYTAICEVIVNENIIHVTSVELDENELSLNPNDSYKLTATVLPTNATYKNVIWSSSDESIATVDKDGNVKAISPGTADITVTTEDGGYTSTCSVVVRTIPVTGVTLNETRLELVEGESTQLTATVLPENATNKDVTWSTSDKSVATVDKSGNIKAISEGIATITVITKDGNKTATCEVNVAKRIFPVTGVTLDKDKLELAEGGTAQLTATVLPENATNKKVTWSSSDESVATVDENGNVKAISEGTATITVTTKDGNYKASCTVIVYPPEPVVIVEDGRNYQYWGDILVKYKLLSNNYGEREALLLSKFNGDGENGYVDGTGILRIPDHVVYYDKIYYVKRIPSEWSDGSNNIDGIEFESNVSHLREICDYAFKGTDALDNYHLKVLTFPEGLEYIGTEAFYNVDRSYDNVMYGIDFPSTLNAINVRAFANAGYIGNGSNPATLMFRGNFNTANMCEKVFYNSSSRHYVQYIYAPVMEIAANIANHIRVCYEDDFTINKNSLIPKVIGS